MAKRIKISTDIPSLETPWDDGTSAYDGAAVERFIKSQLTSRIGYLIIPQEKESDGYYHLWGFQSQSDYNDWLSDNEANAALRLVNVAIPILDEEAGVSNVVTLTRNSAASVVTNKPNVKVNVTYLWQQYNPVTQLTTDQDEDATIVVSCRTQNASGSWGAWDATKQFTVNIQSGQTKDIDVSSLLVSDATYQVRFVATGETSGISASPVTVNIVYSNVSAKYEGDIATVYQGASVQLPFRITGSVAKQLRIKINGYTKNYTLGTTAYTDNTYGANVTQSEFQLARGAVQAEAWVAFGEGFSAETEHFAFQFVYLPEGDTSTTPILAVTDVLSEFENWTRTTIFKYAIYNPVADETYLKITMQDRESGQIYIVNEQTCVNGTSYAFDENFALEYDGEEPPSELQVQVTFVNASNVSFGNSLIFTVDNSENFAPTSGVSFILSPEKRLIKAGENSYALNDLLLNTLDTNTGWRTSTETDSYGTSVNIPVLTIAAENRLTIPYQLFDANTGHNNGGNEGSITIEFDIRTKNIVGDAVIIDSSAVFSDSYTGLKFYPTRAVCLSQNNFTEDICDVLFSEEKREHIAINIIRNLRGEGMNLVRIYVNGKANRSFIYTDEDSFVPVGESGPTTIVIGSDEADIDIFGIRVYKGQQLGSTQIQNDYMASMSTIADKKLFKLFNSIYTGTEISYEQCNALGLNTILRKIPTGGHYPSRENQEKQKGVDVDVRIYSVRGNADSLDTVHSGTFTNMTDKGQGTSAMGYYWWNITDGFEDDEEITSEQYDPSNPTHYVSGMKFYKKKSYFNSLDGTSQVYSSSYELEAGRAGITKLVGKCNYASSMQSHKLGGVWAYDELWQMLVNNGSGGRTVLANTHAACYQKPFLCFYQIGTGSPTFCGFQTWGSGKGDKKTFGYNKSNSPAYLCISGADNGAIAALYQMPWLVSQNENGAWTGNIYAKSVTINTGDVKNGYCYKSGSSDNLAFEVEIGSKYDGGETVNGVLRIADEAKGGTENTLYTLYADFANFVFSCSPHIKAYSGTEAQLVADSANLQRDCQYWLFNTGSSRYDTYYYNPASAQFEKVVMIPTTWGTDGRATAYGSPKITEQLAGQSVVLTTVEGRQAMTLEQALNSVGFADLDIVSDLFSQARVQLFKAHAEAYLDLPDIIFHQCMTKLLAGTDNRTKNVYSWIDPAIDKLVRWKQDDLDTILATDNQGRQTKPYYTLEHTKDGSGSNYWNGENNVLFTLLERAYDDRMRNMMRDIFSSMAQICGSVDNYMQQRFYWVQEYFPASAYNETGRVLYEVAQVKLNNGTIDVSQDPITQAVGDQLECEKQFMSQRLPMLMSWCEYETGGDGTLSFRSVNNLAGQSPTYDIEYTAYQYIYPKLAIGGNIATLYAKVNGEWVNQYGEPYLCAPGETVRFVASTDSNTQLTMRWMHYAKSLGNLGNLPCGDDGTVTVSGKRLRKLECSSPDGQGIEFHPIGIAISNCRNLESVDLTNASNFAGGFSYDLPRLKSLKLRGTAYTTVTLPKTSTLIEVNLPATITAINVNGTPNLTTLTAPSLSALRTISIKGSHKLGNATQTLMQMAFEEATSLVSFEMENVDWSNVAVATMSWLVGFPALLTGRISLTGNLTLADKLNLVAQYGDIDSESNALYITYSAKAVTSISISGPAFITEIGDYQYSVVPSPDTGNDIAIVDGQMAVEWTIEGSAASYASFSEAVKGLLSVVRVDSVEGARHQITCSVTKKNGTQLTTDFLVGFYRRIPKIGDFAYADGTFDDMFNINKTIVGVVYKINEMWQGGGDLEPTAFTGYDKPSTAFMEGRSLVGYQLLIDCKEHVHYHSADNYINSNATRWGIYSSNDSNGISDAIRTEIAEAIGTTLENVADISSISNISVYGLDGGANNAHLLSTNYLDENQVDGFKNYSSAGGYVADWQGRHKTNAIVNHATRILVHYLLSGTYESVNISYTDDDGVEHTITSVPTNVLELSELMEILNRANNQVTKYYQLVYPAAYGCYLYEPQTEVGETLDEQYKQSRWYLPAMGEIMRQYSFAAVSRTGGIGASTTNGQNTLPNKSVIDNMIQTAINSDDTNEIKENVLPSHIEIGTFTQKEIVSVNNYFHSLQEAKRPIYSMLIWRAAAANANSPFIQHSTGSYWSSTEYHATFAASMIFGTGYLNGGYAKYGANTVRPAVAYSFLL